MYFDVSWPPNLTNLIRPDMNIHEYQAKALFEKFGVPVPKGTSVVRFTYVPLRWAEGVTISLGSLIGLVAVSGGLLIVGRLRRRRR